METDIAGAAHGDVVAQRQVHGAEHLFVFQHGAFDLGHVIGAHPQFGQVASS